MPHTTKTKMNSSLRSSSSTTAVTKFLPLCLLLFFTTLVLGTTAELEPKIVEHPQDVRVMRGRTATLRCRVTNIPALANVIPVQWVRSGLGLGKQLLSWPRYQLTGESSIGEYNLRIDNVQLADEGEFECQVVINRNGTGTQPLQKRSRIAHLTVLVPPSGPVIANAGSSSTSSSLDEYKVIASQQQQIPCLAYNGKPTPYVEWYRDGVLVPESWVETRVSDPARGLFNTTSYLHITPRPTDSRIEYTCLVSKDKNEALEHDLRTVIRLKLMRVPSVKLTMPSSVDEQSDVIAKCQAYAADPPVTSYRWSRNGVEMMGETGMEYRMRQVDRSWRDSRIGCQARNEAGFSEIAEKTLDVQYAPILFNISDDAEVEIGDTVTLHCWWDAHPSAVVTWTRQSDDTDAVLAHGNVLTLSNIRQQQSDLYVCRASSQIGSSEKMVEVKVRGAPIISSKSSQAVALGSDVEIVCSLSTVPGIDKAEWSWNSNKSQRDAAKQSAKSGKGGGEYKLRSNEQRVDDGGEVKWESVLVPGEQNARLRIYRVDERDMSTDGYRCTVRNAYGTASQLISLHKALASTQESDSNMIAIICGVAGGVVFVIAVLLTLHCVRIKHQRKSTNLDEQHLSKFPAAVSNTQAEKRMDMKSCVVVGSAGVVVKKQQAPTADDDLSDDNPRASISSRGDAPTSSSCNSTSNDGNPTPTSVHDDGYHTEVGSWSHRHGTMKSSQLPSVNRLPTISSSTAAANFATPIVEDDQNSSVSDVALNFPSSAQMHDASHLALRTMSALQQPFHQSYAPPPPSQAYGTAAPTGYRSASVLAERMQASGTPGSAVQQVTAPSPSQQYYPRDYAPLLPMAESYPIDRLYGSSQSSLEKYERSSLLSNGMPPPPPPASAVAPLMSKRMNQSSRGSSDSGGTNTIRSRMATHV